MCVHAYVCISFSPTLSVPLNMFVVLFVVVKLLFLLLLLHSPLMAQFYSHFIIAIEILYEYYNEWSWLSEA